MNKREGSGGGNISTSLEVNTCCRLGVMVAQLPRVLNLRC